jgi:hypothetical protein
MLATLPKNVDEKNVGNTSKKILMRKMSANFRKMSTRKNVDNNSEKC